MTLIGDVDDCDKPPQSLSSFSISKSLLLKNLEHTIWFQKAEKKYLGFTEILLEEVVRFG
jgi:hypothetical protein